MECSTRENRLQIFLRMFFDVEFNYRAVPEDQRYNEYLQNIQQAVLEGMQNAPCDMIYSCNI